jgi:GNAT superfamily N-acetyltransferase
MAEMSIKEGLTCEYSELESDELPKILPLYNALVDHLSYPPAFLRYPHTTEDELARSAAKENSRYFAAKEGGVVIGYIKIGGEGENFATADSSVANICGAYCLPEYRGTGVSNNLLAYVISVLKREGYTRLGVDFESYNPTAHGFWLKYFTEYTNSLVRRIDEKILEKFTLNETDSVSN